MPNTPIILGGPQASAVDTSTMANFSSIDFVVRQEAEDTLPKLLEILGGPGSEGLETLPGITFRRGTEVIRNPDAPVISDLDRLPLPAFRLLPQSGKSTHLEIGRGCPLQCTFCSTSKFFGQRFRLKSPGKMIDQMSTVKERYGVDTFFLDHDMFTADRRRVVRFCEALLISAFIESEGTQDLRTRQPERDFKNIEEQEDFTSAAYPYQPAGVWMARFKVDYQELLDCLRNKKDLKQIPLQNVSVVFQAMQEKLIHVHQLSGLSEELWQMCNGTRPVRDIIELFSQKHEAEIDAIPVERACIYGLRMLKEQVLIGLSSRPPASKSETCHF